jgi:hypothetical protein
VTGAVRRVERLYMWLLIACVGAIVIVGHYVDRCRPGATTGRGGRYSIWLGLWSREAVGMGVCILITVGVVDSCDMRVCGRGCSASHDQLGKIGLFCLGATKV